MERIFWTFMAILGLILGLCWVATDIGFPQTHEPFNEEAIAMQKFIETIRDEKDGFRLFPPWRIDEDSLSVIVPIIRKTDNKRDYITFAEAENIKAEDTGQIDYIYVKNDGDIPVFLMAYLGEGQRGVLNF